jgi:hypothetical protein
MKITTRQLVTAAVALVTATTAAATTPAQVHTVATCFGVLAQTNWHANRPLDPGINALYEYTQWAVSRGFTTSGHVSNAITKAAKAVDAGQAKEHHAYCRKMADAAMK